MGQGSWGDGKNGMKEDWVNEFKIRLRFLSINYS